ncbi:uncharacterized protein K02A2.6-like [Mya arenaria]|uniref:uncharacterized protein K02A2.6-like n=1 Tax=Mya arenaria TaxID=6604 RepID=UPI0022E84F7A|nr:uncharacterized protein K02A2.6-like [Mya arenaria]
MAGLAPFPKFDVYGEETSLGTRWTKYVTKLENLFTGLSIDSKKRRKALLLHYAGDEVFEIYETLNLGDSDSNYDDVKQGLTGYFQPKKNREFERFEFRNLKQHHAETIDQFATRLRHKADNCEFSDKDGEIKSQIIQGCVSKKLRLKCLEEDKPLKDILTMGRTMEIADRQAKAMEPQYSDVNKIKVTPQHTKSQHANYSYPPSAQRKRQQQSQSRQTCRNCGGIYPHQTKCPAYGATCNYCRKPNHFIGVCRKRTRKAQVHGIDQVENEAQKEHSVSDTDTLFGVNVLTDNKVPKIILSINGVQTKTLIDTGSSINIISQDVVNKMKPRPMLKKTNIEVFAFAQNKPLTIKGKYTFTVETKSKVTAAEFHVVQGSSVTLISYQTSVELGIVPVINSVNSNKYEELCDKYQSVFTGLGKLKDKQIKFHVDENVVPIAQPARRIPFHVREKVEQEIIRLEQQDVIEKVDGPTPWVSNIVVAPKPNAPDQIRLCVDMRKANQALKRERHVVPTTDDIILELNGSKVFSKVDFNKGFHQLELSEESRNMTVFASHVGLYRYKRLNFGVSVAPEIFQNEIRQVLTGLEGTLNISDDIIIHAPNRDEHDRRLVAVLQRMQDKNLTLNKQKCEFGKTSVKFYGFVFSDKGISPDPAKITAVQNIAEPKTTGELRSFLGMTNYLSKFIDKYSTITAPLRDLLKDSSDFKWTNQQQTAFDQLKQALCSDTVMSYFDPKKHTELWVDASPEGISGILIQENKVIAYGSRSLTPVEKRYSQTEREMLACVWGCKHFHIYLYGKAFQLVTDCRPLLSICTNSKQIQSARLERWRLRLTTYNFTVKHMPGNKMIADYCSRHPINNYSHENIAEEYVNFIANAAVPKSLNLQDVARATAKDCVLTCIISALQNNTWIKQTCAGDGSYNCYQQLADELTVLSTEHGNVLLRGIKLCIPNSLQSKVISLAHEGHQGRNRTKALLREACWFPYLDKLVDEQCKNCIPCMSASPQTTVEPIKPSPLPKKPWDEVSVDFCGPFPTGEYFMVVICDYSRYPLVEKLTSLTAQNVISHLERIFGMFSIPSVVKSDNGAPFNSHEFTQFANSIGFKHRKVTPLAPQANGLVEAFMKPLVKTMKTATASGKNFKSELTIFLMNYRSTPHPSTGLSPFEIMFNRKMKTKLPTFIVPRNDIYVRKRDTKSKQKNKKYADEKRKAKPCTLQPGDPVLVKQPKQNKLTTPFSHKWGYVVRRKGSMVTVRYDGREMTRDAAHFKLVPVPPTHSQQHKQRSGPREQQNNENEQRRPNRHRQMPIRYRD